MAVDKSFFQAQSPPKQKDLGRDKPAQLLLGCVRDMKSTQAQHISSGVPQPDGTLAESPRLWPRLVRMTLLVAVLVGLGIIWRLGIIDAFLDQSATSLP